MIQLKGGSLFMNTHHNDAKRTRRTQEVFGARSVLGTSLMALLLAPLPSGCSNNQTHPGDEDEETPEESSSNEEDNNQKEDEDTSDDKDPSDKEDPSNRPKPGSKDKKKTDECVEPKRIICDKDSEDPLHAFGINCPGDSIQVDAQFSGVVTARGVLEKLGNTKAFEPREGKRYLVLGTGNVAELQQEAPSTDIPLLPTYCSDDLQASWDKKTKLPAPIVTTRVGKQDCMAKPSLIGTGDCSNTIQAQWEATKGRRYRANDLQELRIKTKVPSWARSLTYDFAFLTTEYPGYYKNAFNDLFIAWLESKSWTGNISFDKKGSPISLNAGFLDYRDARQGVINDPECATGCTAKELEGTCMKGHAATRWLSTKVGVTPGEEIELVFTIVDLGDSMMDSYVLLDNFRWSCDVQKMPETDPPPPI